MTSRPSLVGVRDSLSAKNKFLLMPLTSSPLTYPTWIKAHPELNKMKEKYQWEDKDYSTDFTEKNAGKDNYIALWP